MKKCDNLLKDKSQYEHFNSVHKDDSLQQFVSLSLYYL